MAPKTLADLDALIAEIDDLTTVLATYRKQLMAIRLTQRPAAVLDASLAPVARALKQFRAEIDAAYAEFGETRDKLGEGT